MLGKKDKHRGKNAGKKSVSYRSIGSRSKCQIEEKNLFIQISSTILF